MLTTQRAVDEGDDQAEEQIDANDCVVDPIKLDVLRLVIAVKTDIVLNKKYLREGLTWYGSRINQN